MASLLLGIGALVSCSPGALDCEDPAFNNCEPITGKAGGSSGGGGGGAGGSAVVTPTATTPVPGCTKYPNLGAMDMLFAMRCGTSAACHGTGAPWSDMKAPEVWKRMLNVKAKTICPMDTMINGTDHTKSLILTKTKQPMPKCPTGGAVAGSTTMPPPMNADKVPSPLPADEIACIEAFVKAAAGK